jgi:hypothetical protein
LGSKSGSNSGGAAALFVVLPDQAEAVYSGTMLDAQPVAVAAPRIVATVSHYAELLQTIRNRVAELEITHETLDAVAGLQSGYTSKLLCSPPIKRMGAFTQFIVLQALGMKLLAVEDPKQLARVQSRLIKRQVARRPIPSGSRHSVIKFEIGPDLLRQMQSKGGKACMARMTPKQRSAFERKAARARWDRHVSGR